MHLRQKVGAWLRGARSALSDAVETAMIRWNRDKVTSQDDQIRMQIVNNLHRRPDWHSRENIIMKVAELRDRETVEGNRQPGQHDFNRNQDGEIRLKKCTVFAQGHSAGR